MNEETPLSLLFNTLLNAGTPKLIQTAILNATLNLLNSEMEDEIENSSDLRLVIKLLQIPQQPLKQIQVTGKLII